MLNQGAANATVNTTKTYIVQRFDGLVFEGPGMEPPGSDVWLGAPVGAMVA